eukprot:7380900-Prymnesium_polylepis.1
MEDASLEKLRQAKDLREVGGVLESIWRTHPLATNLRSRLCALIMKSFPSLTATFKLSRCALTILFDESHKRARSEFEDCHETGTSIAPMARKSHSRSGGSGARYTVRCVDETGQEQRFNLCIQRRDWCRTVTCIDDRFQHRPNRGTCTSTNVETTTSLSSRRILAITNGSSRRSLRAPRKRPVMHYA